jgi:hypothetical protein
MSWSTETRVAYVAAGSSNGTARSIGSLSAELWYSRGIETDLNAAARISRAKTSFNSAYRASTNLRDRCTYCLRPDGELCAPIRATACIRLFCLPPRLGSNS